MNRPERIWTYKLSENDDDCRKKYNVEYAVKNERNTERIAAKTNAPTELKVVRSAVTADNCQTDGQLNLFDLLAS